MNPCQGHASETHKQELTAALTVAGAVRWQYPELSDELRELCARVMVQQPAPCEKCHGAGWVRGHELDDADDATRDDTMTQYKCDACPQPVSTAEVPMPQGYAERPSDYTGDIWIESQMRTYGDAREASGYARGLAAESRAKSLDAILCERLKRCVRVENKLVNTAIGKLPPLDNAGLMALARELGTPQSTQPYVGEVKLG